MISPNLGTGLVAALTLLHVGSAAASAMAAAFPVAQATGPPKAITTLGCYSGAGSLTSQGSYTFQTSGYCQQVCAGLNMPVMATTQGSTCYCGNQIPAQADVASNSSCNVACDGYGTDMCGGNGYWTVYLTGLAGEVPTVDGSSSSSSSGPSSTSAAPSVITKTGGLVTVTATSTGAGSSQNAQASGSGGSSKVGIAVGVVIGLLAVAAIVSGTILYLKQRRKKAVEEEFRRNASVQQFVSGGTPETKSTNDQRLDPSVFALPNSRQSIGSIADERDFSRRILQVRNPDANRDSVA